MNITTARHYQDFRIYIDGIIHLCIKFETLIGFESWYEGECEWFIEFYFKEGEPILCGYQSKETWIEILKLVDYNL